MKVTQPMPCHIKHHLIFISNLKDQQNIQLTETQHMKEIYNVSNVCLSTIYTKKNSLKNNSFSKTLYER